MCRSVVRGVAGHVRQHQARRDIWTADRVRYVNWTRPNRTLYTVYTTSEGRKVVLFVKPKHADVYVDNDEQEDDFCSIRHFVNT